MSSLGEGISRAHLAGIIEAAMDAIVTVDEQQCVVAFNPAAERMFGHAREAVLGRALSLLLPARFHAGHADHVQSFGVSGVTGRSMGALGVLTARRADGTEFPIEAAISQAETDGRRLFTAVVRDISERIAAEQARARALEALRESEERFRLLVDGVQDYAIFMLDPEGRIVSWNSGAERTMGYAADEAIGQHVSLFYPPEDVADGWLQRELSAAASGRFDEEAQRVRKDGSRFWASVVTTALRDEQGGLRGYAKVTRDISERKRIEAERSVWAEKQARVAETLQRSLLLTPPPDAYPGLRFKPFYRPALDEALVGGDFLDVFAVRDDVIALVVGDATGKGLNAATYTAEIRFALRAFLREHGSPAPALRLLNQFVVDNDRLDAAHLGSSYVTAAVILTNTKTGEAVCSAAGAEPPLRLRRNGNAGQTTTVNAGGPLLGALPGAEYEEERIVLDPDDLLILTTDGITEARRRKGDRAFFGVEGLAQTAGEALLRGESLAEIGESVIAAARDWSGGALNDDVCLLLVRRQDPPVAAAPAHETA